MANKIRDLSGLRIGALVVQGIVGSDEHGRLLWRMLCDCGNSVVRKSANIARAANDNKPSSCGCQHHLKTHGLSKSHRKLYQVWKSMRARCERTSCKDYPSYGGRGITVCDEWKEFAQFARWASESGYTEGLTIERVDVNAGYCPQNCTWMPNPMQARNRRHTHTYTHDGVTLDIRGWSERSGISYHTLRTRLVGLQWPIERAISEPVRGAK